MSGDDKTIAVQNVNVPGKKHRVDRARYEAMRKAMLRVLPAQAPGFTQSELFDAVVPHLPDA